MIEEDLNPADLSSLMTSPEIRQQLLREFLDSQHVQELRDWQQTYVSRPPSRPASRPPSRPTSRPGTPSAINEPAPPKFVYSELTDQEKAEFESIKADAFKSACTLALLPGRIPMCFACGQCYVTDYFVWDKFWSNI